MLAQSKLTPDTQTRIVQAIRVGATYALASQFGGVSYQTFRTWVLRGEAEIERRENPRVKAGSEQWTGEQPFVDFVQALRDAEGAAAVKWLALIDKAAEETWQAAAWKLERRYPRDYGRTVQEVSGPDGDPTMSDTAAAMVTISADLITPSFVNAHRDVQAHRHTEYVFHGGRGSTKSSFISLEMVTLLVNNPDVHALVARQVANTLRDSVYAQLVWAIAVLGLTDRFKCTVSPLEITYIPTGQRIYFRGADEPGKIKSIKPPFGYIGVLWFEELDQFHGPEAVRNIEQSAIRGGDLAWIFKSFNPPRSAASWANKYAQMPKANQLRHRSDYRDVPPEWLGQVFLDEAEHLKEVNPVAYEHEYLGISNGTGGLVFENVELRAISDDEIYGIDDGFGGKVGGFDRIYHGLDFGFYPDPAAYNRVHYDAARLTLYVFGEVRRYKTSNRQLYDDLVAYGLTPQDTLIADSAEPKSVADFRSYGANCRGAEKGPESVKYSMKWLQSLRAIVIDPARCPETAQEVVDYELEQDKDGNWISEYPDANNHQIDAVRYATNTIWKRRGQ